MAAEHNVFGRFGGAAGGIEVGAETLRAGHADQISPIVCLADKLVAGGGI